MIFRQLFTPSVLIPFFSSLVMTMWIFRLVVKLAIKKDIVDCPNARKLQKTPVPVMGGFAVYFGIIAGAGLTSMVFDTSILFSTIVALTVMMYFGLMDDSIGLKPLTRIIVEAVLVFFIIRMDGVNFNSFQGIFGIWDLPTWCAYLLSAIAGVGIINAINMIDGVDGLSSGFCILACVAFGCVFKLSHDGTMAVIAALGAGALIPFFIHNIFGRSTKMFIGDSGTMMMGMLMTIFLLHLMDRSSLVVQNFQNMGVGAFALSILSVPVFDTLRVMTGRIMRGISPFHADKSHLHHLFIEIGFSHVGTALMVISLDFLCFLIWLASYQIFRATVTEQFLVVALVGFANTTGFYYTVRRMDHRRIFYRLLASMARHSHVETKPWFLKVRKTIDKI